MVRFFKIPSWQVQQGELVPGEAIMSESDFEKLEG